MILMETSIINCFLGVSIWYVMEKGLEMGVKYLLFLSFWLLFTGYFLIIFCV